MDETVTGLTTLGQSEPGSNGYEEATLKFLDLKNKSLMQFTVIPKTSKEGLISSAKDLCPTKQVTEREGMPMKSGNF